MNAGHDCYYEHNNRVIGKIDEAIHRMDLIIVPTSVKNDIVRLLAEAEDAIVEFDAQAFELEEKFNGMRETHDNQGEQP